MPFERNYATDLGDDTRSQLQCRLEIEGAGGDVPSSPAREVSYPR